MARGVLSGIGLGAVFSLGVAGAISVLVPINPQPLRSDAVTEPVPEPVPAPQAEVTVTREDGMQAAPPQISLRTPAPEISPDITADTLPDMLPEIIPDSAENAAAAPAPQVGLDLDGVATAPAAPQVPVSAPARQPSADAPQSAPALPVQSSPAQTSSTQTGPIQTGPAFAGLESAVPAAQPRAGSAGSLNEPRPLPRDVAARAAQDAPVLPNPQALAPMIPDAQRDTPVQADAPPAPPVPEAGGDTQPQGGVDVVPRPRILPAPDSRPALGGQDPDTAARPSVGRPATTLATAGNTENDTPIETVTQDFPGDLSGDVSDDLAGAALLRRYAQPFENPQAKPLMSIVLMDTGADLDATEIGLPALTSFPYPVSFAVDAGLPDAFERMARYRAEGFDVLAMVDLPEGARPTDAEVSLAVALKGMPEIVGVLEGTGAGLQGTREVADQVTSILKASGHGLVTQSKGLNSMPKLAVKEGVPAAAVFRDFDSEDQEPRVIRRFLDQAAFKADQEGGVIVLGRLRPGTIEALLVWGLADRAGSVALAPVSAVLLGQR
jgi:polysaccharide deacetylase 2 family uncharacterized protein YibQ